MCGINGIYGIENSAATVERVQRMNDALAHRGPDDAGVFSSGKVVLGHRRLSIIDLSSAGHQPMLSYDKRYAMVYNGELYNFEEIKKELKDYPFATHTDSEVILAAYARWGKDCLQRFNGMFAFAIWDEKEETLFIARDRLGIKPLYYYRSGRTLVFSSELRSVLSSGLVPRKINAAGLSDYLRYQTVHAPGTIVDGVKMLMPGHWMTIDHTGQMKDAPYWSMSTETEERPAEITRVHKDIRQLLKEAVERRLVADVPFGAFLSGGIDSSAIVGLMSEVATTRVQTFSVTFNEEEFSEAKYARMVAEKFGTEHHEIRLSIYDFITELPDALKALDHPSGDGPNTYVVSKATKAAGITMALSGLGGDELFAGYDVFKRSYRLRQMSWLSSLPQFSKNIAGKLYKGLKPGIASSKLWELLQLEDLSLASSYPLSRQVLSDETIAHLIGREKLAGNKVRDIVKKISATDSHLLSSVSMAEIGTYMQNVLLRDTDQMSMAHALEVRVPFLDYKLVEYVLGLPDAIKYPHTPKKLLVDSLGGLLPDEIVNRPKMGFTLPWKEWMKRELRNTCEEKIISLSQRKEFHANAVTQLWNDFLKDHPEVSWSRVWYLVVLESWLQENQMEQ